MPLRPRKFQLAHKTEMHMGRSPCAHFTSKADKGLYLPGANFKLHSICFSAVAELPPNSLQSASDRPLPNE
ncbi:hypothetical protein GCM10011273_30030 [Asticcacaulis endophyticus]|uniref:Uncharacterized protein n=1 Tax=Asticcacaulis endophyticus TaxID=1395890 RepID=A0A918QDR3_9CAUL|nr:hypothetical protein GCM10011273_30030 [Asticcacaulis endophyticus]